MQHRGLYSWHRRVPPTRLHLLLTSRLRVEEEWGRGGEGSRGGEENHSCSRKPQKRSGVLECNISSIAQLLGTWLHENRVVQRLRENLCYALHDRSFLQAVVSWNHNWTGFVFFCVCVYVCLHIHVRVFISLQLPVISVVRETETQLLPDVGAIVTCKVRVSLRPLGTYTRVACNLQKSQVPTALCTLANKAL